MQAKNNNPSLFNTIVSFNNIFKSYKKVLKNKSLNMDVLRFNDQYEFNLKNIQEELCDQTYKASRPFVFTIRDPKKRLISSLKTKDMVVQMAIFEQTYKIFNKSFIADSYGGIPKKGPRKAIKKTQLFARKFKYYLKCDISGFYDSIDHDILQKLLGKIFKDDRLLLLFKNIIDSNPRGVAIGALLSQYFANLYLTPLDNYLKCYIGIKGYVRYMDDFIIFHNDIKSLNEINFKIKNFLIEKMKLELNTSVNRIDSVLNGVEFLGFRIYKNLIRVRRKNMQRIRKKIKKIYLDYYDRIIDLKKLKQKIGSYINHLTIGDTINHNKKLFSQI